MTDKIITVIGSKLRVGDTIGVWWSNDRQAKPRQETIKALVPYDGPLAYLWAPDIAQLADFCANTTGMTIEPNSPYEVFERLPV